MQTINILIIMFGAILCLGSLGTFVFLFFNLKYKHFVEVREILSGGKKRVKLYKACDLYSKDKKVKNWKLKGMKDPLKRVIPVPPNEVIDTDIKGRNFVVVYITETGEIVFRKDDISIKELPKDFYSNPPKDILEKDFEDREEQLKEWRNEKYEKWLKETNSTIAFQPYSTNQRIMHVSNARKAEEQRAKGNLEKFIPVIGLGIIVVFIIIFLTLLLVFWADLTEPVYKTQQEKTAQLEIQNRMINTLNGIDNDIQVINNNVENLRKNQEDLSKKIQGESFYKIPN